MNPEPTAPCMTDDEARWNALCMRDATHDGHWVYGVRTTGVYCRPSCGARRPRRENVSFHADAAAAEAAGFRPCKRCRPHGPSRDERHAQAIAAACQLIAQAETPPDLDCLARAAGMSRFHFHRVFKERMGLTPRADAAAERKARVRAELARGESVTAAIYGAGFNSNGRFYAVSADALGMKPGTFRRGGAGERIRYAVGRCSLGVILVAATARGLCTISLGDDAPPSSMNSRHVSIAPSSSMTMPNSNGSWPRWSLSSTNPDASCPLDVRGTAFQERVWQVLSRIPAGTTMSYAALASAIGQPRAVRAVARACAANTRAVAIPCHRVVRNDGGLSGYRWGVERKRALLAREAKG